MIAIQKFDGFISKRKAGDSFARSLKAHMVRHARIHPALDTDLDRFTTINHVDAAKEAIRSSYFTIVLVDSSRFEAVTDTRESYQLLEVTEALTQQKKRQATDRPHGVFIVHLTDDPSDREADELNAYLDEIEPGSRNLVYTTTAPLTVEDNPKRAKKALQEISANVRDFMDQNELSLVEEEFETAPATLPDDTSSDLSEDERSYLDRNFPNWLRGQIDDVKRVGGDTQEDVLRSALFDFAPARFIMLDGRRTQQDITDANGEDSDPQKPSRQPILKLLLESQPKPVFIAGPAGAGKTATLTTTAALEAFG